MAMTYEPQNGFRGPANNLRSTTLKPHSSGVGEPSSAGRDAAADRRLRGPGARGGFAGSLGGGSKPDTPGVPVRGRGPLAGREGDSDAAGMFARACGTGGL